MTVSVSRSDSSSRIYWQLKIGRFHVSRNGSTERVFLVLKNCQYVASGEMIVWQIFYRVKIKTFVVLRNGSDGLVN